MTAKNKYQKCLSYIERFWGQATFSFPRDNRVHFGLPNKFVSPNSSRFGRDQFYWDSYFIILGLAAAGRIKLAKGMVDNFVFIFNKLGFIPVRNIFNSLVISQPPFLTSMALEVFEHAPDKKWLARVAATAAQELGDYWQDKFSTDEQWPKHLLKSGLSRYAGSYRTSFLAEYESGWDDTSRFDDRCLDFAPVDLNCLLYKYEKNLAEIYARLGSKTKQKFFRSAAKKRQAAINKYCWREKEGFFFDYDDKKKKTDKFHSLAGFYPLWSGLASKQQAAKAVKNLKKFETAFGLANTQKEKLKKPFRQWDYPNGWPNQQWIVIKGLLNYGYREDAERLAKKWLDLNLKIFQQSGKLWEKYDVARGRIGLADERYKTQAGFGWTNAVFLRLCQEFNLT